MKMFQQPVFLKAAATPTAVIGPTASGIIQTNDGFQSGDLLARTLNLRISGNLNLTTSSAGTTNAAGVLKNLRGLTVKTDKHQTLIDNVDGLGLYRLGQFLRKNAGSELVDIAANTTGTPAFSAMLEVPFYCPGMANGLNVQTDSAGKVVSTDISDFGNDSRLDMFKSRMSLIANFGGATDFIAGGTYTDEDIQNLNLSAFSDNEYPIAGAVSVKDKPNAIMCIEVYKAPITASVNGWTYDLPYGDRVYKMIAISQRDLSTFAELPNSVIADGGKLGLSVNNVNWFPDVLNHDIQSQNQAFLNQATMPTGWTVLDFSKTGRKSEMLNTLGRSTGKVTLKADVLTGSNYGLYIYVVSFKDIPLEAQRADAEYQS